MRYARFRSIQAGFDLLPGARMFRVPTYVAPSAIAGMGVFTSQRLPAGTTVWKFTEGVDWRIPPEDFETFPEPYRSRLRHYLYQEEGGSLVLCGDNAKFMNHSSDPNCSDADLVRTVTRRVIEADEELTCDYHQFDFATRAEGLSFGSAGR